MNNAIPPILLGGFTTVFLALMITRLASHVVWLRFEHVKGPQKVHENCPPRIGGIAVFLGSCVFYIVAPQPESALLILLCVSPVFLVGLAEDLTNRFSASVRLLVSVLSASLLVVGLDIVITDTGFRLFDTLLHMPMMAVLFSVCAVTTHCHALNIVDGLNGLAGGTCIIALGAVAFLAGRYGDTQLCFMALGILVPTAGFMFFNFPKGYLFLGDGGAYFLGSVVAALVIILPTRNPEVSSFSSLLIVSYPVYETLRSYIRRSLSSELGSMQPDDRHLHSRVYKLISQHSQKSVSASNALASTYVLFVPGLTGLVAVQFHDRVVVLMVALLLKILLFEIVMHEVKRRV